MHHPFPEDPYHEPYPPAGTHRHDPPQATDGSERAAPPLSPTEQRVYTLLLRRMTEQQVADELERSPNTIHVHVRNIYRKMGIRSRRELFDIAANTAPGPDQPSETEADA